MLEIGQQHGMEYRQEILQQVYGRIKSAESCCLVGAGSMGKTRLLDHLMRPDVRQHYLKEAVDTTLMLRVDCNRMHEMSEWGFFELLLAVVSQTCGQYPKAAPLRSQMVNLEAQVITTQQGLMGLRYFELAMQMLCIENGLKVCLLLDEFDEAYKKLPHQTLQNLRAIRDANKNRYSYVLLLRNLPERLRKPDECEGFFELFSRSEYGIGPYSEADSRAVIKQWEARHRCTLTASAIDWILWHGAGHPGLMQALFGVIQKYPQAETSLDSHALLKEPSVSDECRKLGESLLDEEKDGLISLSRGMALDANSEQLLKLKGLIKSEGGKQLVFSPVFAAYLKAEGVITTPLIQVDTKTHTVFVEGSAIQSLSALGFKLIALLASRPNQVFSREEIVLHLYGDRGEGASDSRLDNLVSRVRQEIEQDPQTPRYLLTQHGVGFRLYCG